MADSNMNIQRSIKSSSALFNNNNNNIYFVSRLAIYEFRDHGTLLHYVQARSNERILRSRHFAEGRKLQINQMNHIICFDMFEVVYVLSHQWAGCLFFKKSHVWHLCEKVSTFNTKNEIKINILVTILKDFDLRNPKEKLAVFFGREIISFFVPQITSFLFHIMKVRNHMLFSICYSLVSMFEDWPWHVLFKIGYQGNTK